MIGKILILTAFVGIVLSLPQNIGKDESTSKPNVVPTSSTPPLVDKNNSQGQVSNLSYGFFQTVRKEWKCSNGQCQEHVTKCKNGKCESAENKFKADNYQPEVPQQFVPFPFPTFNFAELFNFAFPKLDLESFFKFDNFGLIDTVMDPNSQNYYYTESKFISSKCNGNECLVHKKDCTNGKCNEVTEKRSLRR